MRRLLTLIPFLTVLLIGCFPMQGTVVTAQSFSITPSTATLLTGEQIELAAPSEAVWEASGGLISPTSGRTVVYTAPVHPGRYIVTARDPRDPARRAVAVFTVRVKLPLGSPQVVAAADSLSYAVADDGTVWAWGSDGNFHSYGSVPLVLDGLRGAHTLSAAGSVLVVLSDDGQLSVVIPGEKAKIVDSGVIQASVYKGHQIVYVRNDGSIRLYQEKLNTPQAPYKDVNISWRKINQPLAVWAHASRDEDPTIDDLIILDLEKHLWRVSLHDEIPAVPLGGVPSPVESVAVYQINGDSFFLLKTEDGQLWHGWLGNPNSFYAYSLDIPVKRAKDFAISRGGLLVIDETGAVWQTKPLDFINMTWSQVTGLKNIRQVAVGDSHYLAVRSDGTIFAWGKNDKGQLGDGTTDDSDTPVEVLGVKARVP